MSTTFPTNECHQPVMSVRGWVFRLIERECTEDDFLAQMLMLEETDTEIAWEALALLDQQRRKKHLDEAVFQRVKRRLQQQCLKYGADESAPPEPAPDAKVSVPESPRPAVPVASEVPPTFVAPAVLRTRRPTPLRWIRQGAQTAAALSLLGVIGLGGYLLLGSESSESSGNGYESASAVRSTQTTAAPPSLPSNIPSHGFLSAGFGIPSRITPRLSGEAVADTIQGDVLDLPRPLVRIDGNQPVAKIWVRRRGDLRGPVTFYWWTETGSAQVMRDFTQIMRRWEVIGDGQSGIELQVPLTAGALRTGPHTFYVKIARTRSGALLGRRTLAQIEILPPPGQAVAANSGRQAQ